MYTNILKVLKENNVKFEDGLTMYEISKIEKTYDFSFPKSLQELFMVALPVSAGFYNWRNKEEKNVSFIKSVINQPVNDIERMPHEIYWCDDWGEEPDDENIFISELNKKLKKAPKVIPIYSHRYMPITNEVNPPIISIYGGDIIYMGKNLEDYIEIEFGSKNQSEIDCSNIKHISFWSDLM